MENASTASSHFRQRTPNYGVYTILGRLSSMVCVTPKTSLDPQMTRPSRWSPGQRRGLALLGLLGGGVPIFVLLKELELKELVGGVFLNRYFP